MSSVVEHLKDIRMYEPRLGRWASMRDAEDDCSVQGQISNMLSGTHHRWRAHGVENAVISERKPAHLPAFAASKTQGGGTARHICLKEELQGPSPP